ncbi:LptM family lipoprotein [Devosia sp. SL43]|uniref:LptM family lipoprotein n=1 Tax=Devosia sp. SL43 TaxID=2806348 RepID=UPI001F1A09E4|nr:hypothetical protein [Devosia sp. SL43]UJW85443.1 hypothetical protein IM737_18930 [Devosia sp. SL43]
MNKLIALGLAAVTAVTLAGCSVTGGDLIRPGEPTATLIIINGSYGYLDAIVISDCNNFTYGFNRLSDGDSIAPGDARTFTLSSGCWDVGGGELGGGEAYERMNLAAGSVTRFTITE